MELSSGLGAPSVPCSHPRASSMVLSRSTASMVGQLVAPARPEPSAVRTMVLVNQGLSPSGPQWPWVKEPKTIWAGRISRACPAAPYPILWETGPTVTPSLFKRFYQLLNHYNFPSPLLHEAAPCSAGLFLKGQGTGRGVTFAFASRGLIHPEIFPTDQQQHSAISWQSSKT